MLHSSTFDFGQLSALNRIGMTALVSLELLMNSGMVFYLRPCSHQGPSHSERRQGAGV